MIKILFCFLFFGVTSYAASGSDQWRCDVQKLRHQKFTIGSRTQNPTVHVIMTKSNENTLSKLGFKAISGQPGKGQLVNVSACPSTTLYSKLFSTQDQTAMVSAVNGCQENRARAMGLVDFKPENYGSMEGPPTMAWQSIMVCTDGRSLSSCSSPSIQMQKCLEGLN